MSESVEKLNEELVYDGYRKIIRKTFRINGVEKDFEVKEEADVSGILGLTSDNKVILVEQFRPGLEKVLLEMPGGVVDPGEDGATAAKREFIEETGYEGEFQFVVKSIYDPYSTRFKNIFVATNCHKVAEPEEGEVSKVIEMPLEEFKEILLSGEMTESDTGFIGLNFLGL